MHAIGRLPYQHLNGPSLLTKLKVNFHQLFGVDLGRIEERGQEDVFPDAVSIRLSSRMAIGCESS